MNAACTSTWDSVDPESLEENKIRLKTFWDSIPKCFNKTVP